MKIYNKKGFFNGLAFCACGMLNLVLLLTGWFQAVRWFWWMDTAILFLLGGGLVFRAMSQDIARRDLTENWKLGGVIIYNKNGFLDGLFLLLCAVGSMVTAWSKNLDWHQHFYTVLFAYFGLNRIVRAISLEDAKKDIVEERDERNQMVILKAQAMSFQITQVASLLLMCFFVMKGGHFNQLDLVSAGVGAAVCFLVTVFSGFFAGKYYKKHL